VYNPIFTAGGTVQAGAGVYIRRRADDELLERCLQGDYAYVLSARQVGKSSLMVNVANELEKHGIRSAVVDLTYLGQSDVSPTKFYIGILSIIGQELGLQIDVVEWWDRNSEKSYSSRFADFFREVVLKTSTSRVVVFVDEIDTTLTMKFTDDFFAAIRFLYNGRAEDPELRRLSFVLVGVATPTDLIQDPQRTPFNVGHKIDLSDFTLEETLPLAAGLGLPADTTKVVTGWALHWTGGHPYLTQRLFRAMALEERTEWTAEEVDAVVNRTFFTEEGARDSNLAVVGARLAGPGIYTYPMLTTYRDALRQITPVLDNPRSEVKTRLKLIGVVKSKGMFLVVRNRIYEHAFNLDWVREQRTIQQERATRVATVIAVVMAAIALVLGAYGWYKDKQARSSEERLRVEAELKQKAVEANLATSRAWQTASEANDQLQKADELQQQLRMTAEGQRVLAEAQAELAKRNAMTATTQTERAEASARLAVDNAKLANENERKATENASAATAARDAATEAARRAAASEVDATRQRDKSNEQARVITGYKLISDAQAIQATQYDASDTAVLLCIEAYRRAPTLEAAQAIGGALQWLPKRFAMGKYEGAKAIAISDDGSLIGLSSQDGTVRGLRVRSSQPAGITSKLSHPASAIAVAGNGIGGVNDFGEATPGLPASARRQRVLALKSDGSAYAASGNKNTKSVDLYFAGNASSRTLEHRAPVRYAIFAGDALFSYCTDNTVYRWDLRTFQSTLIHFPDNPFGTFSGSGFAVYFKASLNQPFLLFNRGTGIGMYGVRRLSRGIWPFEHQSMQALEVGHIENDRPIGIITVPTSSGLVTASGAILRRWLYSGRETLHITLPQTISAAAASQDDRWIATLDAGDLTVWLSESGPLLARSARGTLGGLLAFSAERNAFIGYDGFWAFLWRWDQDSISSLGASIGTMGRLVLSADGSHLATFGQDITTKGITTTSIKQGLNAPRTNVLVITRLDNSTPTNVPFAGVPGQIAISASGDFTAVMVDSQVQVYRSDGRLTKTIDAKIDSKAVSALAISPDGTRILIGTANAVQVFGSDGTLDTKEAVSGSVFFSRDGKYFTLAERTRLRMVETATLRDVWTLPNFWATSMVFSADGKYVAGLTAASSGVTVHIWNVPTGTEAGLITMPTVVVTSLAFDVTGKYLATGGLDGIRVWVWRPEDLIEEACSRVRRASLTQAEWGKYLPGEEYNKSAATCPPVPDKLHTESRR
jgi:WD40 repeat protein